MSDQTIGARVKKVRKDKSLTQGDAAKILGISLTGWQKIERNESIPGGDTLLDFAKFDVQPGWVLTGIGPKELNAPPATLPSVDPELLETLAKVAQRVHEKHGLKLPAHKLTHEASLLFNNILARVTDIKDKAVVEAMIPVVADDLDKRLREAQDKPGSGKRSA